MPGDLRLERPRVKVGEKEIELTDEVIEVLRKYVNTGMTLEELAKELGLNGWEEAYELVRGVPAWLLRSYTYVVAKAETEGETGTKS